MIASDRPEFSRLFRLPEIDRLRDAVTVTADEAERAALARRFGVDAIAALTATVDVRRDGDVIDAQGRMTAALTQRCVASDDPLAVTLDEDFVLRFEPEPAEASAPEDEIELAADACDVMHYQGGAIDIGEAVAQTLLLSLDPYPRGPGAADFLREKGVKSEEEAGAFGVLAALKGKLGGE